MGAPLVTLSQSDLPGVIREALRAALDGAASPDAADAVVFAILQLHDGADLWAHTRRDPDAFRSAVRNALGATFDVVLHRLANAAAQAITLAAGPLFQPPALTPAQVMTIASALEAARDATRGVIRRNGDENVPAYVKLLEEQQVLLETFDALLGDRRRLTLTADASALAGAMDALSARIAGVTK